MINTSHVNTDLITRAKFSATGESKPHRINHVRHFVNRASTSDNSVRNAWQIDSAMALEYIKKQSMKFDFGQLKSMLDKFPQPPESQI